MHVLFELLLLDASCSLSINGESEDLMKQIESSAKPTVLLEETKLFVFLSDKFTAHQFQPRSALSTRVMHLIIAIYIGYAVGILVIKFGKVHIISYM